MHIYITPSLSLSQKSPPEYDVSKLLTSVSLYSGARDLIADPQDVADLIPKIKDVIHYSTVIPRYEHLDFIWGMNARTIVYDHMITDMNRG